MIKVDVYKEGNFAVSAKKIKDIIKSTLEENGVISDFEVDVAIVSEPKMDELVKKYYQKDLDKKHSILTFPSNEMTDPFVSPPDSTNLLGNIVISYAQAVDEAKETERLVDDVVVALVKHGTLHLLGIHHN